MNGLDILWLALCIFYEARGEPLEGQIAVAHVVVNRAEQRGLSIEEVIKEPNQFEWYKDATKMKVVYANLKAYFDCVVVVYECAKERERGETLDGANHFYNPRLVDPHWTQWMIEVAMIGNHRFLKESE